MNLSILYRGPLSSCNYACDYCPFAKRTESAAELAHDRDCLDHFVNWVRGRGAAALLGGGTSLNELGGSSPHPAAKRRHPLPEIGARVSLVPRPGFGERVARSAKQTEPGEGNALTPQVAPHVSPAAIQTIGVLFTPWGEALVRRWYQDALAALTRMPHVAKAAIQTNLSCKLDWVEECDRTRIALWCTFHPAETTRDRFLAKCHELIERGVRFSVGVVGLKEHLAEIEALRQELPADVYIWVNAYKRAPDYYTPEMVADLTRVDPLFPLNNQYHASRGESCRAGASVISVDGDGTVRRCHFIKEPIGNIYASDFAACLAERPCANDTCGCHIGHVHLDRLKLYDTFGDGVLERIPLGYR